MKVSGVVLFLAVSAHACLSQELPIGWAIPPSNMTRQEFRQKDPNRFLSVKGDFNGDGVQDKALLLVNLHSHKMALFVCLTAKRGCDWRRLEVMDVALLT